MKSEQLQGSAVIDGEAERILGKDGVYRFISRLKSRVFSACK